MHTAQCENYRPEERDAEALAFYEQMEREAHEESESYNPIESRIQVLRFVSTSKGRGRKRKTPVEITLVRDRHTLRVCSGHLYKCDEASTEMLPHLEPWDAERVLRNYIEEV